MAFSGAATYDGHFFCRFHLHYTRNKDEIDFLPGGSRPLVWRIISLQIFRLVAALFDHSP